MAELILSVYKLIPVSLVLVKINAKDRGAPDGHIFIGTVGRHSAVDNAIVEIFLGIEQQGHDLTLGEVGRNHRKHYVRQVVDFRNTEFFGLFDNLRHYLALTLRAGKIRSHISYAGIGKRLNAIEMIYACTVLLDQIGILILFKTFGDYRSLSEHIFQDEYQNSPQTS